MKDLREKEWFFSQERTEMSLTSPTPCKIYRLNATGHTIAELEMDIGASEPFEVAMIADAHICFCDLYDEEDSEISYTRRCRFAFDDMKGLPPLISALECAAYSDRTVLLGDTMDYMSHGTMNLMKKHVFDRYPDALAVPGGHDITKQMQTGRPNLLSEDERYAILSEVWSHNPRFFTKCFGNVRLLLLDITDKHYYHGTYNLLKSEIDSARDAGEKILIFQHEPLSTRRAEDEAVFTCFTNHTYGNTRNFYNSETMLGSETHKDKESTKIYELITESADVIKGIFTGHLHNQFYTEIPACYEADGKKYSTFIPQHTVMGNAYFDNGFVMILKVK